MSFHIPIIFDDPPFFQWGDMRRPQDRRNRQSSVRRQPSLFDQWEEPEFLYDYPSKKQHYRQNYCGQQRKIPQEEYRFQDEVSAEEDINDPVEHRRIGEAPRGYFGWDGWDIPVQYMDKPTRPHHKHKHKHIPKTKSTKACQDLSNDSDSPSTKSQRELNEASKTREIPVNRENETERGNDAEVMKTNSEKQPKVIPKRDKMEPQSVDNLSAESSTQTSESENNEIIEIPISYSTLRNTHRQHSKRLSQCDPPSPADIKLARIKSIVQKTEGIDEKIMEFADPLQNKNYLYISETLMKLLLDLDTIDSEGFDVVRKARKEGVQTVQALVDKLETKLEENKQNSKPE